MSKNSPEETARQKANMLLALEASNGNIRGAAKLAKINPSTHYQWLKEDPEYAGKSENMKDICFRNSKEQLLDLAFKMAEKGNVQVLNRLLGIYLKNLPEEMKMASYYNNVHPRVGVRFINKPLDPRRTDHLSPEERQKIEGAGK